MSKTKSKVLVLLIIVVLIAIIPLFALKGAEFGGSDDAGSVAISQITGKEYTPWFTPIMETAIGGELPGEIESLLFCVQTGIGVGILAFFMGRFVERTKQEKERGKRSKAE
jgi:cobalt/nickel transport protein